MTAARERPRLTGAALVSALNQSTQQVRRAKRAAASCMPHSVLLVLLGAGISWFGCFGSNAGSALGADQLGANAFTATQLAAAAVSIVWVLVEQVVSGKMTAVGPTTGGWLDWPRSHRRRLPLGDASGKEVQPVRRCVLSRKRGVVGYLVFRRVRWLCEQPTWAQRKRRRTGQRLDDWSCRVPRALGDNRALGKRLLYGEDLDSWRCHQGDTRSSRGEAGRCYDRAEHRVRLNPLRSVK